MPDVVPINRAEALANPFRSGNGVPPPFLAGRDGPLAEVERVLAETHRLHANPTPTGIVRALPDMQDGDQVVARLLERGLVYRPSRGRYDFALPLFRADLRGRADLPSLSRAW